MNEADQQPTNNHKQAETEDELEIEISDLSPEEESHFLLLKLFAWKTRLLTAMQHFRPARSVFQHTSLSRQTRRARLSRRVTAAGLILVLCVLLIVNVPVLRTR